MQKASLLHWLSVDDSVFVKRLHKKVSRNKKMSWDLVFSAIIFSRWWHYWDSKQIQFQVTKKNHWTWFKKSETFKEQTCSTPFSKISLSMFRFPNLSLVLLLIHFEELLCFRTQKLVQTIPYWMRNVNSKGELNWIWCNIKLNKLELFSEDKIYVDSYYLVRTGL